MARDWIFTINTFESNTRDNYKKMLSLTNDHYAKLVAAAIINGDIIPLRNDYEPLHNAFVNGYAAWQGQEGDHEGDTLEFERKMDTLPTELRVWEGQVRAVFPEDTPDERRIFPNKRTPFLSGTYEQKLSAIKTLYEKLATYTTHPTLVTLSGVVQDFYDSAKAIRDGQQGEEIEVSDSSRELEEARLAACTGMYGNLGRLMYIYRSDSIRVQDFWDMTLLRNLSPEAYTEEVTVDGGRVVSSGMTAEQRELVKASTSIYVNNNSPGNTPLQIGFAEAADQAPASFITLPAGAEATHPASELGWSSTRQFLVYQNITTETGTLQVEVNL